MSQLLDQVNTFIRGQSFFQWHGIVLSSLWILGSVVAILSRKVNVTLHALLFFVIDAATAFFIVGGMLRVYPHMADRWDEWSVLKRGHFLGGGFFLVLLVIQHLGGVSTLLKGIKFNPAHRKLGYYVANFGRILAVFGSVIAKAEPWIIYTSGGLTLLLLVASTYVVFFKSKDRSQKSSVNQTQKASTSPTRNKSPKRD